MPPFVQSNYAELAVLMTLNLFLCILFIVLTKLSESHHAHRIKREYSNSSSLSAAAPKADKEIQKLSYLVYSMSAFCAIQCLFCHFSFLYHDELSNLFCRYLVPQCMTLYYASKASLYGFFLQRAKLSQGVSKLFPDYLFKYILPCYILMYFIVMSVGTLTTIKARNIYHGDSKSCVIMFIHGGFLRVAAVIDVFNVILFLYLFIKPLKTVMDQTRESQGKFKKMIIVNVVLSLICCLSSFIVMFIIPFVINFKGTAGNIDQTINVICVYFMMAKNRRYAKELCNKLTCTLNKENETDSHDEKSNDHSSTGHVPLDSVSIESAGNRITETEIK